MGVFERYLSIWVGLCIISGVVLGLTMPAVFQAFAAMEVAHVNVPVAVFIWIMIFPMMVQVDFGSIRRVGDRPKGLIITLVTNWVLKPFSMAFLGWLFFRVIFVDLVDPQTATEYIAGMILLGVAPCTAMVFVWSQLTDGDPNYTLVQVSVNDLIMIFAFAPIAGFLLGVTDVTVPWDTLLFSVALYVLLPLMAGALTRKLLLRAGEAQLQSFLMMVKPLSITGLLATVVLLFGFQAGTIIASPLAIVLIAIPLLIQTYGIFALAYGAAWAWRVPHAVAAPSTKNGKTNFHK